MNLALESSCLEGWGYVCDHASIISVSSYMELSGEGNDAIKFRMLKKFSINNTFIVGGFNTEQPVLNKLYFLRLILLKSGQTNCC